MNLASAWEAVADRLPDNLAQIHGSTRITFRELDERAARLASALAARGVGRNSKVAMYLFNCVEYLETCFAAMKLRAIPVNVNYRYLADELHYLIDNSEAEVLVYHGALAARVDEVRGRLPKLRALPPAGWALLAVATAFLAGNYLAYLVALDHTAPADAQVVIQLGPLFLAEELIHAHCIGPAHELAALGGASQQLCLALGDLFLAAHVDEQSP